MSERVYRIGTMFVGAGGAHLGAIRARAEALGVQARFESAFAIDAWGVALETCHRMTGCDVQLADLFDEQDYAIYHGHPPPPGWISLTPAGLRALCPVPPDIISGSPPCKGFTHLISQKQASLPKYAALNRLVVRWLWLCMEAWPDRRPAIVLMENVPGIADVKRRKAKRGEELIQRIERMLESYGYATRRTVHDCGELGNLPQTRKRFLLIARNVASCPTLLYEPWKHPLRSIGSAVVDLPVPAWENDVPHHQLPNLHRATEQRLAFVSVGADWRSIEANWRRAPGWAEIERDGMRWVVPTDGDGAIDMASPSVQRAYRGVYGVCHLDDTAGTITGNARPCAGPFAVAEPLDGVRHNNVMRVARLDGPAPCVTGGGTPTAGGICVGVPVERVEDPAMTYRPGYVGKHHVHDWRAPARTITGSARVGSSPCEVADPRIEALGDPRLTCKPNGATLRVVALDGPSPTITGTGGPWTSSSVQIAAPMPRQPPRAGAFGVQSLDASSCTITGSFDVHNSAAAIATPPRPMVKVPLIAPDGFWKRAMTARELMDLMTFPRLDAHGQPLVFAGTAADVLMQTGNAIPPDSAQAIFEQMLMTFLCRDLGVSIVSGGGVWVRERRPSGWVAKWHPSSRRGSGRSGAVLREVMP